MTVTGFSCCKMKEGAPPQTVDFARKVFFPKLLSCFRLNLTNLHLLTSLQFEGFLPFYGFQERAKLPGEIGKRRNLLGPSVVVCQIFIGCTIVGCTIICCCI